MSKPLEINTYSEILLRQFNENDSASIYLFAQSNQEQLNKLGLKMDRPPTVEVLNLITSPPEGEVRFSIWHRKDMVGGISYTYSDNATRARLEFLVGKQFEGKGYMRQAIYALTNHLLRSEDYKEVYTHALKDNERCKRVLQSLDFSMQELKLGIIEYKRTSPIEPQYLLGISPQA